MQPLEFGASVPCTVDVDSRERRPGREETQSSWVTGYQLPFLQRLGKVHARSVGITCTGNGTRERNRNIQRILCAERRVGRNGEILAIRRDVTAVMQHGANTYRVQGDERRRSLDGNVGPREITVTPSKFLD